MTESALSHWRRLTEGDPGDPAQVAELVDSLLSASREVSASDVHLLPSFERLEIHWRLDGVLQPCGELPGEIAANVVARLKVLADLLTYRTDVPQEGRIRGGACGVEMRLSTFPTLHGEKAVVRLFAEESSLRHLADLRLGDDVVQTLRRLLGQTSGAVLITGPAGSGKTTTAYACLRELAAAEPRRSIATLEDPVEVEIPGVAQSQANAAAGFDLPGALRFLMRQDPEVILVGEIRDPTTAQLAMQAALTGHLVISTFHAGGAAESLGRLLDMGVEPYVLCSSVLGVVSARLVRRLCICKVPGTDETSRLGLHVAAHFTPQGCPQCRETGYRGRTPLAELLTLQDGPLAEAVLARRDVHHLRQAAIDAGMTPLMDRARQAIEAGLTSAAEVRRELGVESKPVSCRN